MARRFSAALGVLLFFPFLLAASPLAGQSPPAPAEGAEDAESAAIEPVAEIVDEIVVTSRRRKENLQQVPLSVTAFDETALEERLMVDVTDIAAFTPNVDLGSTSGYGVGSNSLYAVIRGIGQLDMGITADPAVGVYVDGIFLARPQGAVLDLLEVERIEVLRGPQGTLFGKNTTGGAISIITKRPSSELAGRLSTTLGDYQRHDARASIAGSLSDRLHASLALLSTNRNGFSRSLWNGTDFNDDNLDSGRLALRFMPSPNLTLDLTGDFSRRRDTGGLQILLGVTSTPILDFYNNVQLAAGLLPATGELWLTDDFYSSYAGTPSFINDDVLGGALTVNWLVNDSLALQSITSYRSLETHRRSDHDTTPDPISDVESRLDSDQMSQELQLSGAAAGERLSWVLGGLYFRERPRSSEIINVMRNIFDALELAPGPIVAPIGVPAFLCNPGPPPPDVPCFGGAGNPLNFAFFDGFGGRTRKQAETESWALFGEATYDLGDKLSATFGLRFSVDDKWYHYIGMDALGVVEEDILNQDSWDAVTPRASLAYQLRPNILLYLTAAKGYKSGGFNGRPEGSGVLQPYDPEELWSYETGWKSDLLGHRLRLNGALFHSDYDNIHFSALVNVDGAPVFIIQNAGRARIQGLELELEAYPAPGLNVSLALGATDTELVEVAPGVPVSVEDDISLPKAPEWTANAALQYAFDLGARGALIARGDYRYRSKVYNDLLNTETIAQDGYGSVNARLSWTSLSGRWELAGFATNLTDEEVLAHGVIPGGFGFDLGVSGQPRMWGATAQWKF